MAKEIDKVKARIRALILKTENNGCTENEAMVAMSKAGELLDQYNLSLDEITLHEEQCRRITIYTGRSASDSMKHVISPIAEYIDGIGWNSRVYDNNRYEVRYNFFGTEQDVEIAEYLYHLIENTMRIETNSFKTTETYKNAVYVSGGRRRATTSFQRGFVRRIRERLDEMKKQQHRKLEIYRQTTGTDLVAMKAVMVKDEYKKGGNPVLVTSSGPKVYNHVDAYEHGKIAGDRINLNKGVGDSSVGPRLIGNG